MALTLKSPMQEEPSPLIYLLVDDADADPMNEYNTSVTNGTDLEVTDRGTITTDLSSLVDDADADPINELQDLSINATNDSILISNGLGIPAGGIPLYLWIRMNKLRFGH